MSQLQIAFLFSALTNQLPAGLSRHVDPKPHHCDFLKYCGR